jgi:Flp pilus assembly protein TadG
MRAKMPHIRGKAHGENGVTLILFAFLLVMFVAFAAMAVDIAHLYVVRNELKNAADAGALAGARCLYDYACGGVSTGSGSVNTTANQIAASAALANNSEKVAVEVNWTEGQNDGSDVERGHWSFATRVFTPNPSTVLPPLWGVSSATLDANTNFINAVRVRTRRESTQAGSFFARIFGYAGFDVGAEAVAYIGFAGRLNPEEVDQPIAICQQSILDDAGNYTCNTGRMLNSGGNADTHNTAAWTNFSQDSDGTSCNTASNNELKDLICQSGNPRPLIFGVPVGTNGGVMEAIKELRDCFGPKTRTQPWSMTLPVIDCAGNNPNSCHVNVVGAVEIQIVWISDKADPSNDDFPPSQMGDWTCPSACSGDATCCWNDFVTHFNLKNVDDATATYAFKSIYFLPSCTYHEPTGVTGGKNFNTLAKQPVLVD